MGSMFVGTQNFPGSWGDKSVVGKFGIILISIRQMLVYTFMGMLIRGQGLSREATNFGPPYTMMIPQ